jgi:hypothetical protein
MGLNIERAKICPITWLKTRLVSDINRWWNQTVAAVLIRVLSPIEPKFVKSLPPATPKLRPPENYSLPAPVISWLVRRRAN